MLFDGRNRDRDGHIEIKNTRRNTNYREKQHSEIATLRAGIYYNSQTQRDNRILFEMGVEYVYETTSRYQATNLEFSIDQAREFVEVLERAIEIAEENTPTPPAADPWSGEGNEDVRDLEGRS